MIPVELAKACLYYLWNDADHVKALVENAKSDLEAGRFADALANLAQAAQPTSLLEMRLRDAVQRIREAALDACPNCGTPLAFHAPDGGLEGCPKCHPTPGGTGTAPKGGDHG